ncbi:alpha beta hydrolase fold family [Moniliophthora roreri MCA 2997]|uniref:Alpha beta hydrolase fold family n=2 Tax=Moniliophthora roreri TaxID=221103 RepID=V2WXN2_MONRO|nr:alpha beta hydrolase fold family [Moniliophthora roreri MCA 2997]
MISFVYGKKFLVLIPKPLLMFVFLRSSLLVTAIAVLTAGAQTDFPWNSLVPTTNFTWTDCYSEFQCARLKVPLDYNDQDNGKYAAVAVIRYPSPVVDKDYRGPIFLNPGGPGGSAVDAVLEKAKVVRAAVGPQFDVIGFDPRGVSRTTPQVAVFKTDEERSAWLLGESYDMNSTYETLPEMVARYQVFGQLALSRDNDTLAFITTGIVAQDMLRILDTLDQEKLQYLGFSYGSVLGSTFATMFPERVGRMVIDGCLDMDSYFRYDLANEIRDADKVMQAFFDGCHAAGPEACPFYASSPTAIAAKLDAIYDSLRTQPLPVFSGEEYGIITYDALRNVVFSALYNPFDQFAPLALGLAELASGNGTLIYQSISQSLIADASAEATIAISCSDADPVNLGTSQLREYMSRINSTFAGVFAVRLMTHCVGWEVHPESRFKGPVGANTSFPLLVIGNTADPVTPLAAAKKTSQLFPGAVLLTQDSPGHTSQSAMSSCTIGAMVAYFVNGTLPEEGTVCPVESQLFPVANSTS